MEDAPLSLAYSHARNAVSEQQKSNPIAASEEHDLAAGEFASAAKATADLEALRTLKLLEQHHQKLAELLKFKPEPVTNEEEARTLAPVAEEEGPAKPRKSTDRSHRELSTSIASNLASARGIQPRQRPRSSQPTLSPANADGRMSKDGTDLSRRLGHDRPPPLSPSSSFKTRTSDARGSPTKSQIPPSMMNPGSEDAFTRWYSNFESIGTKLSAALAFTGLPLGPAGEEEMPQTNEKQGQTASRAPALGREASRTTPSGSPDVSRFFSRAALKAVRDETGAGVAESFYVVPTSGGTVSYRDMLSAAGTQGRQGSGLSNVDEAEEFVDAREVPGTASFEGVKPRSREADRVRPDERAELTSELNHWKALALETGERLRAFEMNAQRESIMHASMFRGAPGLNREGTGGSAEDRIKEDLLQAQTALEKERDEVRRLSKENKKLEVVLQKYRKKFDELKDNARERLKREEEEKAKESSAG